MDWLADVAVIALWGMIFGAVWSMIGVACMVVAVGLPALFGLWRLARVCAWLHVAVLGALWVWAMAGLPWPFALPTRPHAAPFVLPLLAFWPALAALLITRYRLTPRASAENQ